MEWIKCYALRFSRQAGEVEGVRSAEDSPGSHRLRRSHTV